jgi:CheY-like chemotaxis protein
MEITIEMKMRSLGRTVLVVDDSEFLGKTIERAFLSDGFEACVEAANGRDAIEAAKQCHPDLIILDLSMPVMNGWETTPTLHKMFPKVPIFLFSMYADVVDKHLAAEAGIKLVLSKREPLCNVLNKAHEMLGD